MILESASMPLELQFQPLSWASTKHNSTSPSTNLLVSDSYLRILLAEASAHQRLYDLDPELSGVLERMAPGRSTVDLPRLVFRSGSGIVAFDDSWTLLAWSLWWTERYAADSSLEVVILHADDHRDLVSPLLAEVQRCLVSRKEGWIDVLTGRWTALSNVQSVASAILSGAVGIGTFMVPLIHSLRRVEIRHLRFGSGESVKSHIRRSKMIDKRLLPIAARISLEEGPVESTNRDLACVYTGTSDVGEWVEDIPANAKVLLHIDLDYFNDRYAGGRVPNRPEPREDEMRSDIDSLCDALAARGVARRIENTAIALSPGFCPSQHWEFLLEHLRHRLHAIGCLCP
jgi:hypothetical protein